MPYISEHMASILEAPEEHLDGVAAAEKWTRRLGRAPFERKLRPIQGEALESFAVGLREWRNTPPDQRDPSGPRGILGPIGVGHGKTLITLLLPEVYRHETQEARCPTMLIVPPDLVQKTRVDFAHERRHFKIRPPNVVSMGILSHANHSAIFERMKPKLVIVDEAHKLAAEDAARTRRLVRWFQAHPDTVFVALSGTITSKSIKDYGHLSLLALRGYSPIPSEEDELELWRSMLDVKGEPDAAGYATMLPLINWYRARKGAPTLGRGSEVDRDEARLAYQARLRSLPGVVGTDDASSAASLNIRLWKVDLPQTWKDALDAFDPDEGTWELPGDIEVTDALAATRARFQLASGYFTRWVWPDRPCPGEWAEAEMAYSPCRGSECRTCNGTRRYAGPDHEWMEWRRRWNSTERAILKDYGHKTGHDSPALIRKITASGGFGHSHRELLARWEKIQPRYYTDGLGYQPPVEYVNLDPGPEWITKLAWKWARTVKRGLIWYNSPHLGEALAAAGFRVFGAKTAQPPDRLAVACVKIDVHGTGKNLQAWSRNLVLESTGNARTWEQFLGRTHRPGQTADEVGVDVLSDGYIRDVSFHAARIGAEYIQDTTGMTQRLRYATIMDPINVGTEYHL